MKDYSKILKANPYHDATGKFSSKNSSTFQSLGDKFKGSTARDKEAAASAKPYEQRHLDKLRAANESKSYSPEREGLHTELEEASFEEKMAYLAAYREIGKSGTALMTAEDLTYGLTGKPLEKMHEALIDHVLKYDKQEAGAYLPMYGIPYGRMSVSHLESMADKVDPTKPKHLSSYGALAVFSKDKDVALTSALSGWAMSGGGHADQLLIHKAAAKAFEVNNGKEFFEFKPQGYQRNPAEYVPPLSDRFVGHVKALHAETQEFYSAKFATKTKGAPDLSTKELVVSRGVGGKVSAYAPAPAESWTTDKATVARFGKMMAKQGRWSSLTSKTTYSNVLFSYESVKGKYGWPEEKELKGKKEFVVFGGGLKDLEVSDNG